MHFICMGQIILNLSCAYPKTAFKLPVPSFGTCFRPPEVAMLILRKSLGKREISQLFYTLFTQDSSLGLSMFLMKTWGKYKMVIQ